GKFVGDEYALHRLCRMTCRPADNVRVQTSTGKYVPDCWLSTAGTPNWLDANAVRSRGGLVQDSMLMRPHARGQRRPRRDVDGRPRHVELQASAGLDDRIQMRQPARLQIAKQCAIVGP